MAAPLDEQAKVRGVRATAVMTHCARRKLIAPVATLKGVKATTAVPARIDPAKTDLALTDLALTDLAPIDPALIGQALIGQGHNQASIVLARIAPARNQDWIVLGLIHPAGSLELIDLGIAPANQTVVRAEQELTGPALIGQASIDLLERILAQGAPASILNVTDAATPARN
jgi:hypothetical protein